MDRKNMKHGRHDFSHLTYINQTFGMGGAETVNRDLLLALQEKNIAVQAYTTHQPFAQMLADAGIGTQRLPVEIDIIGDWKGIVKALVLWPFALLQYAQLIWKVRKTDVILMSGFFEKIIVSPIAKSLHVPVVWVEYAPMTAVFQKFWGVPGWMYRRALRYPDRIIVPTAHTKKYFEQQLPSTKDKLVVLPCARYRLDVKKYETTPTLPPTVVSVSRMEPGKGQDILVRAFAKVKKNVPAAQLRLVGAGGFCEVVEKEVSRLGLNDSVKLLGWVEDPLKEVAQASVCVFPSVWPLEGFGMVTIEAMALGKPVVAFKCGPTPYILTDGETGLLAEVGNSDALADHIIRVLNDKTLAAKLGKNAQRTFQERYRFEHIIDQYIDVCAAVKTGQK